MQYGANERQITPCVIVWSRRRLLVDCLSHHFSATVPNFHVLSNAAQTRDASVPTVCIRDVGRDQVSAMDKDRVVEEIRQAAPGARILIFSGRTADRDAREWVLAGAHGYFSTLSTPALLTAAVMLVAAGGIYLPEAITRGLLSSPPGFHENA